MAIRKAYAVWQGTIREGSGNIRLDSGAFDGAYSFSTRFEEAPGTNPEELLGAAHAGCFSMALSGGLTRAGFPPNRIATTAHVSITPAEGGGFEISRIALVTEADVPNIDQDAFQEQVQAAKAGCPLSKALASVPEITVEATLTQG